MENSLFVVRARIGTAITNIIVNDEMMGDCSVFIAEALRLNGIKGDTQISVKFYDNYGAAVDEDTFPLLVRQFHRSNDFFFDIEVTNGGITSNTKKNLELFLKNDGCKSLFAEERRNMFLSKKSRKMLLLKTVNFIVKEFTLNPSQDEIIDVCNSLIILFQSLKTEPSQMNGIDLLFDKNKRCGELYEKIVYRQRISRQAIQKVVQSEAVLDENSGQTELIAFFKSCLLPEQLDELVSVMKDSIEQRKVDLQGNKDILRSIIPLYMMKPELIETDFEMMFQDIEKDAFIKTWPDIQQKPKQLFQIDLDINKEEYHVDDGRYHFLTYLKLFPVHRTKFENAVGAMIIFVSDPHQDLMVFARDQAVQKIIVVDTVEGTLYYILVQGNVMKVPAEYSFIGVVDIFFKIHKVFNLHFDKAVHQLMLFIEYFIFGIATAYDGMTTNTKKYGKQIFPNSR